MTENWWRSARLALATAVILPPVVCLVLVPLRSSSGFESTNAALLLVVVVVAVAALGNRIAGAVAALSSGVWFDFFLTRPYQRFTIAKTSDLVTAALLLVVGLSVTQLAVWGRREQVRASRDEGYLAGMFTASATSARGVSSVSALVEGTCRQLVDLLGLESCRFDYGTGLGYPRLTRDGTVKWERRPWDVAQRGLPMDKETELLVQSGGSFRGRFLLTAGPQSRPSSTQILVATTLADAVGAALAGRSDAQS